MTNMEPDTGTSATGPLSIEEAKTFEVDIKACKICSGEPDGSHFGVPACRACAAFFRRSISQSKRYICKTGTERCKIHKTVRMCKKCRFKKCIDFGMIPEQVQKRPTQDEEMKPSSSTDNTTVIVAPAVTPTEASWPILLKTLENYRHLAAVQRSTEYAILQTTYRDVFDVFAQKRRPILANFNLMCQMARGFLPTVIDFVRSTFEEYSTLEHDDQWTIFRNFAPALWIFQSAYYTHKILGDHTDALMFTQTTLIEGGENARKFYENSAASHNVDSLGKMLSQCIGRSYQLVSLIRSLDPTEIEIAALSALLFWDPNFGVESRSITAKSEQERSKIFSELNNYYINELHLERYAERLGNLMCVYSSVQWNTTHFKEELELYNLMDVFSNDSFIYDFCKR